MRRKILVTAIFGAILGMMGAFSACSSKEAASTTGRPATVSMRDGSTFSGRVTESTSTEIKLTGDDGSSHVIPMAQVKGIEYGEETAAAPAVSLPAPVAEIPAPRVAAPPEPAAPRTPAPQPVARQTPKPRPVHMEHPHPTEADISTKTYQVPAGTQFSVRTEDKIDSATAAEGQTYAAEIVNDVLDSDGNVVIPDGSNAQIVIKSATKGGKFLGASDLVLDLQSVSVNGRRYVVDTSDLQRKGKEGVGTNKRTAVYTGTGAAIGAIIGAIAGGGKGAAIGAASGAGAGAVAQTVTRGNAINVPVETILTFQLDTALRVKAK